MLGCRAAVVRISGSSVDIFFNIKHTRSTGNISFYCENLIKHVGRLLLHTAWTVRFLKIARCCWKTCMSPDSSSVVLSTCLH